MRETVSATKTRIGRDDALRMLAGVDRLVVARGQKLVAFDLAADQVDDEVLLAHLLGPTGNLRAPTARVGRTMLVGFNDEAYREALGVS